MEEKSDEEVARVLKSVEERRRRRKEQEKNVDWYSWLVADHPYLVLFLCAFLISGCVIVSVCYVKPPDFSEPSKGFEVRGTPLSDRVVAWKNLYDNTGFNHTLSTYPTLYARRLSEVRKSDNKRKVKRRNKKGGKRNRNKIKVRNKRDVVSYTWNFTEKYFCHNPKPSYARMIMEIKDESKTLWSVAGLRSICKAEKSLLAHVSYSDVCTHLDASTCCPTLSLSNYVAFLSGLPKCEEIKDANLHKISGLLRDCAPFYSNNSLTSYCWDMRAEADSRSANLCPEIPRKCVKYDAVFSIFHYLTDTNFLQNILQEDNLDFQLSRTAVFLPALKGGKHLAQLYYQSFMSPRLGDGSMVKVTGIDFGLKDRVFDDALKNDGIYPIVAMVIVMLIIVIYTGSVFITLMSIIASVSSLFMSYFLYSVIFEFSHFPFMNLTAIMVMVGIGADNVLVYCSAWKTYKERDNLEAGFFLKKKAITGKPSNRRLGVITKVTIKHAARSMFVTGMTTAAAFLSNFASTVTAIKCFGIYTGLTVLMNLFLCVTWLPAAVIIHERNFSDLYTKLFQCFQTRRNTCGYIKKKFDEASRVFFHKLQVFLIVKWRWFWLAFGTIIAFGGCFVIFVNPKLRLPTTSSYFQYFKSSHPFEMYTQSHSEMFAFEKRGLGYMPVTIIFGITPTDNGNPLDPDNRGNLVFSQYFNMSDPRSQSWLLQFCKKIQEQDFYKSTGDDYQDFRMCFIEAFKKWMDSVACLVDGVDYTPCCKGSTFPYSPSVFNKCLKKAVLRVSNTPGIRLDRMTPGPRYDTNDTLRAVIIEFPSSQPYTGSYVEVAEFYDTIETWLNKELEDAPPGLREDAWFISDLEFHSLQLGLYKGTITAIGLSMGVVCVALILTTFNITITILANLTIAFTIFVTVGVLVLMGWELNILESVTISIAIGLSVDFTVHYAVAYLLAPKQDRTSRVEHAASTMGPAIALAALTTFLAGLCMLPAQVTAYYKFGIFLMLVMGVSWFYGTYFFQALCSTIGPENNCGHLSACCCRQCKICSKRKRSNRTELKNESSTSKCSKTCSDKNRTSSDSHSVTVIEMSSCTST
ncbi:protein dispatched homolog 1-like [Styela clava]